MRLNSKRGPARIDAIATAFEDEWIARGTAKIEDFLEIPGTNESDLLCELIRLDLEFSWGHGQRPLVESYLERFPGVEFSSEEIALLAFEEYRVRFQSGDPVEPQDYGPRLGVDTAQWPHWKTDQHSFGTRRESKAGVFGEAKLPRCLPAIGDDFHGFELVGMLGKGAFGSVFLAREKELSNRLVALKVTETSNVEPQSLARLQHTNIIPIYSLRKDSRLQSICMPFLGVATLRDLTSPVTDETSTTPVRGRALVSTVAGNRASTIARSIPADKSDEIRSEMSFESSRAAQPSEIEDFGYRKTILWIVAQVADGLSYAHSRGIVHGDLKPANILISDDGHPLILDFHLARPEGQRPSDGGLVGGTLPYMSGSHLESLLSETEIGESCDVFSMGVILYEALTGVLPFRTTGSGDAEIRDMIADRKRMPPSVRSHDETISKDVDSIVGHCLTAGHGGYANAAEAKEDLRRHLADLPLKTAPNRSVRERIQKWVRRHPRLRSASSIVAASSIVLLITVSGLLAGRSHLKQAKAENQSRNFVDAMVAAREPITLRHDDYELRSEEIQAINKMVDDRIGSDPGTYLKSLANLPDRIRKNEITEVAYTNYWIAYRLKTLADSAAQAAERNSRLESAMRRIQVIEIIEQGALSPAVLDLKDNLSQRLGGREKAGDSPGRRERSAVVETNLDLMLDAESLFRRGEFEASLSMLDRLTSADSRLSAPWLLKGRNFEKLNDFEKADICYSTYLLLRPDDAWGHVYRGINQLTHKQYRAALPEFDQAIEIDADEPTTYLNRALCRIGLLQDPLALQDLDSAIALKASQTRVHYLRHQVLTRMENNEEAQASLETFVALEPVDEVSWLSRGMAQMKLNRPEEALSDFQSALKLNPDSLAAHQNIATVQSEFLGQTEAAIESMSKLVELDPSNLVARVTRGVLNARINNVDAAHADAKFVLQASSTADIYFRTAGIFALTSRTKPRDAIIAVDLMKKAAFKDPRLVWNQIKVDKDLDPLRQRDDFAELVSTLLGLSGGKLKE